MIPKNEYIVAYGMKMVTMELVENYHNPVAVTSFLGSMAGRTCVMLNNTNNDWSRLIGYYARDYEEWLHDFIQHKLRTRHSEPVNKYGCLCDLTDKHDFCDKCDGFQDNPTNSEETPDPACVIVEGNVLIVVLVLLEQKKESTILTPNIVGVIL